MPSANKLSKTTFRISPDVLAEFQEYINAIGLRRDKYLNRVLPRAVSWLSVAKANSPAAERFWKIMRDARKDSIQKIAVSLDSDVLKKLNAVCADKRVPRDQFFETFLETLIQAPVCGSGLAPLPAALSLIEDPWEQWEGAQDATPFDHILMPDFDKDDFRELIKSIGEKI